jgi:hypothetical protein
MRLGEVNGHIFCSDKNNPHSETALSNLIWTKDEKYINLFDDSLLNRFFDEITSLNDFNTMLRNEKLSNLIDEVKMDTNMIKSHFTQKGLQDNIATMFVCAIRCYTGRFSFYNNRSMVYDMRDGFLNSSQSKPILKNNHLLNSYMLKALHYLPIYFGTCTRCLNLTADELIDYTQGKVVCWNQFSSCTIGEVAHPDFITRTAVFHIFSISGREITKFSYYPDQKEIILLPLSHFLVLKLEYHDNKPHIHLRQIELGISKLNVLWVDENIFNEPSMVKPYLDVASAWNPRIRFILKTSNEAGRAYLVSEWGQKKLNNLGNFRIILNACESGAFDHDEAGIRFCSDVLNLFFYCEIMIYTNSVGKLREKIRNYNLDYYALKVTDSYYDIVDFICFKDKIDFD